MITDRENYLDAVRTATSARSHARFYEALAENVLPDGSLGVYAERAATELRRGYNQISLKLLTIADEAQERAATYRALILEASA